MSALHDLYLHGLNSLKEDLEAAGNDEVLEVLDILKIRLAENFETTRIQGNTKENKATRYEILEHLNKITRDLYHSSFDDYCQSISRPTTSFTTTQQTLILLTEPISDNSGEKIPPPQEKISSPSLDPVQALLLSVKEYATTLQMNLQKAKEVFNSDIVSQEQCEEVLSSFSLFDCSNFPDDNPSLLRAKTLLQFFNQEVKRLIDFCEICDDVGRPSKKTRKRIQDLIGLLDKLFHDITRSRKQLETIDVTTSDEL